MISRIGWVLVTAGVALGVVACSDESTTPVDLDGPGPTVAPALPDDDPNAESRALVQQLAEEECRKDPTREVGVVVIADADGNEVNRFELPCDTVDRASDDDG